MAILEFMGMLVNIVYLGVNLVLINEHGFCWWDFTPTFLIVSLSFGSFVKRQ